ncbi:MAG: riboflavin synthase [Rhodospirillales bacterium]|nr:riboflavin synthase [Rhodospirillales bacterium]
MFTGLITGVGRISAVTAIGGGRDARFTIQTPPNAVWASAEKKLGASIACSGVCLTVIEAGPDWFTVEVSEETLSKTNLAEWRPGTQVNLEGSLRLGDELGGHLVSGHVDGLATVVSITPENGSTRWVFELPPALAPFVAAKGSIALNGVSLTVNEVEGLRFGVNIIPHTAAHTNFATLPPASRVNVEIDMLARYLARQLSFKGA